MLFIFLEQSLISKVTNSTMKSNKSKHKASKKTKQSITHAAHSNVIFQEVGCKFEESLGDINSEDLRELITKHFRWEQISYTLPFDGIIMLSKGSERRLLFRSNHNGEYLHHLKIHKSTMKKAGDGLFADKTFVIGDVISVYLGENVLSCNNVSPYAMDFSGLGVIDAKSDVMDGAMLLLGCHFANDLNLSGSSVDKRKNYNAQFDDLCLVATSNIRRHTEILVHYNIQIKE